MNIRNFKKFIATTTAALTVFASFAAVPSADNSASLFSSSAITVSAANKYYSTITKEMQKFPQGKYWNHVGKSNSADSVTDKPCTHHDYGCSYYGYCDCNSFNDSIQCYGFARKICWDIYNEDPYISGWTVDNRTDNLQPGDYIRINNSHSVFVKSVSGKKIIVGECNYDNHCRIRWNGEYWISSLTNVEVHHAPFPAPLGDDDSSTETAPALNTVWVEGKLYKFKQDTQTYSDRYGKHKAEIIRAGKRATIKHFYTVNNGKETVGMIDSNHYVLLKKNNVLGVEAMVTTNYPTGVNLREKPNTNCEVYGTIPNGTDLQITACNGSWAITKYKGVTGYVNLGICKAKK